MQQSLQEDIMSMVKSSLQNIIHSQMAKVEQAIHTTLLLKQGRKITVKAKMEMKEQMESRTQTLEAMLIQKVRRHLSRNNDSS